MVSLSKKVYKNPGFPGVSGEVVAVRLTSAPLKPVVAHCPHSEGPNNTGTMAIVVAQVVSMLCLGLVTWIVGVLPLLGVRKGWLKESESQQTQTMVNIFSALTCFAVESSSPPA